MGTGKFLHFFNIFERFSKDATPTPFLPCRQVLSSRLCSSYNCPPIFPASSSFFEPGRSKRHRCLRCTPTSRFERSADLSWPSSSRLPRYHLICQLCPFRNWEVERPRLDVPAVIVLLFLLLARRRRGTSPVLKT